MPDPSWHEIKQYMAQQLAAAHAELAEARTIEDIWRCQGKVQTLRGLQHLDQALKLTTDQPKLVEGGSHAR